MAESVNQSLGLAQFLAKHRMTCLDYYVAQIHAQGMPYAKDDILIERVRGGTTFDILVEALANRKTDQLSEYFEANARQLLAAGYTFDQIKVMYDLLEQSIVRLAPSDADGSFEFALGLRSIKWAFQMARMLAVNQYISKINNTFSSTNAEVERTIALNRSVSTEKSPPTPAPAKPVSSPPLSSPPQRDGKSDTIGEPGYLDWPLKVVAGSRPPEYVAHFQNGQQVQVLLVDLPESYSRFRVNTKSVRCQIRRIGPLFLAYPL